MTDAPASDKHDRPGAVERATARIEAMQEQLDALRRDVECLEQSQDDDRRALGDVRQDVIALRGGQDALAAEVGSMRAEQRGLVAQIAALSSRVPTGAAVVAAGGAAGLPAIVLLVLEALRALGAR
jgi:TolA-binding protein